MGDVYPRHSVFLSYSHDDKHIAEELRAMLKDVGLGCFMAESEISASDDWRTRIRDAIRCADTILLLITPRSVGRYWPLLEAGAAWMAEKEVIPLTHCVDNKELGNIPTTRLAKRIETCEERRSLVEDLVKDFERPDRRSRLPFSEVLSRIRSARKRMRAKSFVPELIIGSGVNGSICAGIFAQHLNKRHFNMVMLPQPSKGVGEERLIDTSGITDEKVQGRAVLVVEWRRRTGATWKEITNQLIKFSPSKIKFFSMFWEEEGDNGEPDFWEFKQPTAALEPWLEP